jgi:hypothetical protein
MINEREPMPRTEVRALDLQAMRLKNEITELAGPESIDLAYRILVSCIADRTGPETAAIVRMLRDSANSVAALLERLPSGQLTPIQPGNGGLQ